MKNETIKELICPVIVNEKIRDACGGGLDAEVVSEAGGEIIDGFLTCKRCGVKYPVINGVLILWPEIETYIRENCVNIIRAVGKKNIHKDVDDYFRDLLKSDYHKVIKDLSKRTGNFADENQYCLYYYDDLRSVNSSPVFDDLIEKYLDHNAYKILEDSVRQLDSKGETAIDIGCNVGGVSHFLSGHFKFVYGIDASFKNVLDANMINRWVPEKKDWYSLTARNRNVKRPINVEKADNTEFIVASGRSLPFKNKGQSLSVLSNVIDITAKNFFVISEAIRMLKPDGRLFLSYVPGFRSIEGTDKKLSITPENIKKTFTSVDFYQIDKDVPFFLRMSRDHFNLYGNTCMIGKA